MPATLPLTPNPRYRKPDETGRKPENWPPIPFENGRKIPRYLLKPMEEWLQTRHGATRSMPIAAPLMVIICALHKAGHWLPARSRLARALDTGEGVDPKTGEKIWRAYSIDAALSTALGRGEVREVHQTEPGEVEARHSIRRHRYIIPSARLLAVYEEALANAPSPPRSAAVPLSITGDATVRGCA